VRRLALVLGYNGIGFHGWQRQPGLRTAQGVLELTLGRLLGEEIKVTAAGRTDVGVHARGQVVTFSTNASLPLVAFVPRLGKLLPDDLRVSAAHEVAPGLDARRSPTARRYAYRLLREDDVLLRGIALRPRGPWNPDAWQRATSALEGRHDFTSLESAGSPRESKVCRVLRADWSTWDGGVALNLIADHFLYHMVRNVVGTALALAKSPDPGAGMRRIIAARDRAAAGPCMPPHALTLEQVFFHEGSFA
jgi:tRNA pseudouridine38-40 synthase